GVTLGPHTRMWVDLNPGPCAPNTGCSVRLGVGEVRTIEVKDGTLRVVGSKHVVTVPLSQVDGVLTRETDRAATATAATLGTLGGVGLFALATYAVLYLLGGALGAAGGG